MKLAHRAGAFTIALAMATVVALPVQAHHSFSAVFDATKPISLQGTVVSFELINPHGWVTLDAKLPDGSTQRWRLEVANPNALLRLGWKKDTLKQGDDISVEGFQARDGSNMAFGRSFVLADGRRVLGGAAQGPGAAPASGPSP